MHNIPSKKVNNIIDLEKLDSHLYNNCNMVIDFSFEGAFVSCKQGEFSNYLQNEKEFIQKFRDMMADVQKLSQKTPNKIFNGGEYRHCHKTKNLEILEKEYDALLSALNEALANGSIEKYDEKWVAAVQKIAAVRKAILNSQLAQAKYQSSLNNSTSGGSDDTNGPTELLFKAVKCLLCDISCGICAATLCAT